MITEAQLKRVDEFRRKRELIKELLDSFDTSATPRSRIGIVQVLPTPSASPEVSELDLFFHTELKDLADSLCDEAIASLELKLIEIKLGLDEYIKEG